MTRSNEIGLRIGDGTPREKGADRCAHGRAKAANRGDRFDVQSAHRGKGTVPEGSARESAGGGKSRGGRVAPEATDDRHPPAAGRRGGEKRKASRELFEIALSKLRACLPRQSYGAGCAVCSIGATPPPRLGKFGSRKPSICARSITRTPSRFCKSAIWRWNPSIFVQCTFGR